MEWQFSVPRMYRPKFLRFLWELHCWKENKLKFMEPIEHFAQFQAFFSNYGFFSNYN